VLWIKLVSNKIGEINFIKSLLYVFQRQLSTTDTHRTGMASAQLPEFIRNDKLPWNTVSGRDIEGLSQAPSKRNQLPNSKKRQGQPATGTDQ